MKFYDCLYFIFLILIPQSILGCNFHDFDSYQLTLTADEIELKIKTYLEKDPAIKKFYRLTPQSLCIGDLEKQHVDYTLQLNTLSSPSSHGIKKHSRDLKNTKIAIDPGHFGGSYAKLEERYVYVPKEMTKSDVPICLREGDLTYLTACELRRLLQDEGASVLITRPGIGKGAIKEDFFQWIQTHSQSIENTLSLPQIFRTHYNREDLQERANVINAFSPDITIVIHYNSHLTAEEKEQERLLSESNYNLAFIPGAFMENELQKPQDRYEFLRLLLSDTIEESVKLSECITRQFVKQLNIPLICEGEKTSYTDTSCLFQKPGIYCRNLSLTRLIHSPICYGETLIQNNSNEIYRLSDSTSFVEDIPCPKRVKEVAFAYFEGIKEYLKNK